MMRRHPQYQSPAVARGSALLRGPGDTSPRASGDASKPGGDDATDVCSWCKAKLTSDRTDQKFCSKRCRQTAWRCRQRLTFEARAAKPLRMAYADPPYPGFAKRLYQNEKTYRGEVDHAELVASLLERYDGWALSTGAYALREVLPLCPPAARVCAWVKPIGVSRKTFGIHNTWEPLIVVPGRERQPGKRDWLSAQPARGGGELPGRKPLAFCTWLFEMLGLEPGDAFDDLFPGSGIVTRAWLALSSPAGNDGSAELLGKAVRR